MLRRFSIVVCALLAATVLPHDAASKSKKVTSKFRASDVPSGRGWYCYESTIFSSCARTKEECIFARAEMVAELGSDGYEYSECRWQKKAVGVSYRFVLHERFAVYVSATFEHCNDHRKYAVAKKGDVDSVSPCTAIGSKDSKLQKKVTKGRGFYCLHDITPLPAVFDDNGGPAHVERSYCYRDHGDCVQELEEMQAGNRTTEVHDVCTFHEYGFASMSESKDIFVHGMDCRAKGCEIVY